MRPNPTHFNSGSSSPSRLIAAAVAASAMLPFFSEARAQLSYTAPGSVYSQDFNSLPTGPENTSLGNTPIGWIDDTTSPGAGQFSIVGWYLLHPINLSAGEGGANGNQRMRIGAGTANTGAFMSYGAAASSDRALGTLPSNTLAPAGSDIYFGLRLRNDTGQTLDSFTVSYDGEQWRDGGSATPAAQSVNFGWSSTATSLTNGTFTAEASLSFSSPWFVNLTTGNAVDGNGTGRVAVAGFTVNGVNWTPGTDLWLRWSDVNSAGNDHGLAIDNFSFSASTVVPEPSAWAMIAVGLLAFFGLRWRRN
jgi:hypothetical protein